MRGLLSWVRIADSNDATRSTPGFNLPPRWGSCGTHTTFLPEYSARSHNDNDSHVGWRGSGPMTEQLLGL